MTLQDQIEQGLSLVKTELQDKIQATETLLNSSMQALSDRIYALETRNTGPTILSKLEFENRFTWDEQVAINEASLTDAGLRVLQAKQAKADFIDLVDENTILGLMYIHSKGLLTSIRVDEILTIGVDS
jgi:hypothetical protein